jgi:transketolase
MITSLADKDFLQKLSDSAQRSRRSTISAIYHAKSGHPGGSLSCVDILTAIFEVEKIGDKKSSSHLILSKGHAAPALYAVAADFQIIESSKLLGFRKIDNVLQGHPHVISTPWVETSTGSLGQGFSVGLGMALGYKHKGQKDNVFVILGDGEIQEGEVWEAAMSAAHFKLDNLCVFIDYNKIQSDDFNTNIMGLEPLKDKWSSFNWHVIEIDGHDFQEILNSIEESRNFLKGPIIVIANTIKGKGISYMENIPAWHGSVTLNQQDLISALIELGTSEEMIEGYLSGKIWVTS